MHVSREGQDFMKAILFDLDGVFYVGDELIPGGPETLRWCREQDIPYLFVTNTTSKPPSAIVQKLRTLGIDAGEERILSPPVAAGRWLRNRNIRRLAPFVVDNTRTAFADFELIDAEGAPVEAVVVGDLGEAWDFATLNRAFRYLMQQPAPTLVALGMTRFWRAPDGLRLDAGAFVTALQYASGIEPVVMGKPAQAFFAAAVQTLGAAAADTLLVGDDINSDVGGAQQAGLKGMLVRTGKFQTTDLEGEISPDAVVDSIADLPHWWQAHAAR